MSESSVRAIGAVSGIAGPLSLTVYFVAPALTGWPYSGASTAQLTSYALQHERLFYAGAWFQATGALLSVVFFLALVHLAGAAHRLSGLVTVAASALLLSVVVVEGAFLVAIPQAAAAGDAATVSATFALSNGVFIRVFPLAPASATFVGLAAVILGSGVLRRGFGWAALAIGLAFELVGILAIFSSLGLLLAIVLSVAQEFWILAAAAALGLSMRGRLLPKPTGPGR